MIKHIVWWTLKDEALGHTAAENAAEMKKRLEALPAHIKEIKSLEVSRSFLSGCTLPVQFILQTTHDDAASLKTYIEHPLHQEQVAFILQVVSSKNILDYEV